MNKRLTWALLALTLTGCERLPNAPATDSTAKEHTAVTNSAAAVSATTHANAVPGEITPPTPAPPVDDRLSQALALKQDGNLAEARALLQAIAAGTNVSDQVLNNLGEIDTAVIFSPAPAPEKIEYTIQAGDSLGKLALKYGTTVELLRKANNIVGNKIRTDDRLRIYQGKFAVAVSKNSNTLTVTDNGHFFKRYRVGTGQFSKTPMGDFKITTRMEKPPWYRSDGKTIPFGDPENILGTHWLGLDVKGYGIHGTWETNSIGKQASAGCVRLLNDDVAELYTLLPIGTPVSIHE